MKTEPNVFNDVLEFHKAFCPQFVGEMPEFPQRESAELGIDLIREEFDELIHALANRDIDAVADAIADLNYVVNGFAIRFGINLNDVHTEVQRANMTKVGGHMREDGKVLKPADWRPPDVHRALVLQAPLTGKPALNWERPK